MQGCLSREGNDPPASGKESWQVSIPFGYTCLFISELALVTCVCTKKSESAWADSLFLYNYTFSIRYAISFFILCGGALACRYSVVAEEHLARREDPVPDARKAIAYGRKAKSVKAKVPEQLRQALAQAESILRAQ